VLALWLGISIKGKEFRFGISFCVYFVSAKPVVAASILVEK